MEHSYPEATTGAVRNTDLTIPCYLSRRFIPLLSRLYKTLLLLRRQVPPVSARNSQRSLFRLYDPQTMVRRDRWDGVFHHDSVERLAGVWVDGW